VENGERVWVTHPDDQIRYLISAGCRIGIRVIAVTVAIQKLCD